MQMIFKLIGGFFHKFTVVVVACTVCDTFSRFTLILMVDKNQKWNFLRSLLLLLLKYQSAECHSK